MEACTRLADVRELYKLLMMILLLESLMVALFRLFIIGHLIITKAARLKIPKNSAIFLRVFWPHFPHSRWDQTLRLGAVLELAHSSNAVHGASGWHGQWATAGLQFMSWSLISLPVHWWLTWAVRLCLNLPLAKLLSGRRANNIRV